MPWTADSFRSRHNKGLSDAKASKAASIANAILRDGGDEGIAIATANKRVAKRADGGVVPLQERMIEELFAKNVHPGGLIKGDTPGRTDRLPYSVTADSFVVPADVVSGLGEGNTNAGAAILDQVVQGMIDAAGPARRAVGGASNTPMANVIVASGEYMVDKPKVDAIGRALRAAGKSKAKTDNAAGHEHLRQLVDGVRRMQMDFLKKAPKPKR